MRPNVFLIMTDRHRLDTMHYANPASPVHTPSLDALTAESLCFTNAYTNAPVCTPLVLPRTRAFIPVSRVCEPISISTAALPMSWQMHLTF